MQWILSIIDVEYGRVLSGSFKNIYGGGGNFVTNNSSLYVILMILLEETKNVITNSKEIDRTWDKKRFYFQWAAL